MKKKIIYGLLFAVAMVTASSSFVSCKDYEGDDYAQLKEENLSLRDALNQQTIAMKNYVLKTDYATDTTAHHLWNAAIENSVKALENDSVQKYAKLIHENNKAIIYVTALAKADSTRSWNDSIRIDKLENALQGWGDDLTEAVKEAAKVAATVAADSAKWNQVAATVGADSAKWNATSALVSEKSDLWNKAVEVADSAWNWINKGKAVDRNGKTFESLQDLIKAYEAADDALQDQINALKQDINNILGTLKKQISGIIVQGTYSPVFGYGSLPLGIQTNILSAYVGNVQIAGGKFPSFNSGNYASEKCIFTEGDIQYLSGVATEAVPEGILMNEEDGNAGYMYLTVNPTNIDFTGTDFFLVNSKGDESRIKLSKLEASDDELTFGWTRGTSVGKESPNGFYKVVATIDKGDAKNMQPKFDKAGFKQAVKAATEGQKRMAVKEVAKALFNSLQPTQRFGVKAEWVDTITTKDKAAKRSVTSAYDIAALSIEPLGFGFKSLDGVIKLPTIDAKVIAEDMHVTLTMGDIKVTPKDGSYKVTTNIHLVEFNPNIIKFNELTGKYEFVGDASTYEIVTVGGKDISILNKDQLVNLFRQGDVIEIDVTDFVKEIYGEFNKELEKIDFSGTTANLNKQIDKIANTVNSYIDRANGWINRFNNLFAHLSNALQPVLLWSDGESSGELGGIVSANYVVGKPVKAGSKLCLIPTTYSLELFAPAYKKSLLVTNAYDLKTGDSAQKGNADLKAAADALSNQLTKYASYKSTPSLNKDNMIEINVGNKTGVTYEIAYTALDYEGKVAGRKFYITVVE